MKNWLEEVGDQATTFFYLAGFSWCASDLSFRTNGSIT
jgi:hypothetical protein